MGCSSIGSLRLDRIDSWISTWKVVLRRKIDSFNVFDIEFWVKSPIVSLHNGHKLILGTQMCRTDLAWVIGELHRIVALRWSLFNQQAHLLVASKGVYSIFTDSEQFIASCSPLLIDPLSQSRKFMRALDIELFLRVQRVTSVQSKHVSPQWSTI